jgi:hypothetical protein
MCVCYPPARASPFGSRCVNLTYGRALGEDGVIRMVLVLAGSGTRYNNSGARDEHAMKLRALMIFGAYSSSTVL